MFKMRKKYKAKPYRYNKRGVKVRKNPRKVSLGKRTTHLRNKKRTLASRRKESMSMRKAIRTGKTKSGRRMVGKRKKIRTTTPFRIKR